MVITVGVAVVTHQCLAKTAGCNMTRTHGGNMPRRRSSRPRYRRSALYLSRGAATLLLSALTACSAGGSAAPRRLSEAQIIQLGIDRALPRATYGAQAAVLRTWFAGEQLYYRYMDEPPAPIRADLIAGETAGILFPDARDYATGNSLQSEYLTLMNMKLSLLNGPAHYNLGHPRITSFTGTTATVAWCATDSGTTTQSGRPGPLTLDGGPGGSRGISNFMIVDGSWKGYGGTSISVSHC